MEVNLKYVLLALIGGTICLFGLSRDQALRYKKPHQWTYNLAIQKTGEYRNEWMRAPLDAEKILRNYSQQGDKGLVVVAWPILSQVCAPTIYGNWEKLAYETKIGDKERQILCEMAKTSKSKKDLDDVISKADLVLLKAQTEWSSEYNKQWLFQMGLGITKENIAEIKTIQELRSKNPIEKNKLETWLYDQIEAQGEIKNLRKAGRTIGPYTPGKPGFGSQEATYEIAKEYLDGVVIDNGLIGLRLPIGWASTPTELVELGQRINMTIKSIESRSRMGRGSFGFWGKTFLDWRRPIRPGTSGLTVRAGDLYLIQSEENSLAHEWFHTFFHWAEQNGYSKRTKQLESDLANVKYSKKQIHKIFEQSQQVLRQDVMASRMLGYITPMKNQAWNVGRQHIQNTNLENKIKVAYWYAQVAWTVTPIMEPGETPWIARRRLVEEAIQNNVQQDKHFVSVGYYTHPDEIAASAFQGDINLDRAKRKNEIPKTQKDLIMTPLPIESMKMRPIFSTLFRGDIRKKKEKES